MIKIEGMEIYWETKDIPSIQEVLSETALKSQVNFEFGNLRLVYTGDSVQAYDERGTGNHTDYYPGDIIMFSQIDDGVGGGKEVVNYVVKVK